jgi:hypothetical protein
LRIGDELCHIGSRSAGCPPATLEIGLDDGLRCRNIVSKLSLTARFDRPAPEPVIEPDFERG